MKEILLVQVGKLGDLVLMTPLISELNVLFPQANISLLLSPRNKTLLEFDQRIHRNFIYKKSLLSVIYLFFKLRTKQFDLVIDPKDHRSNQSRFLAFLAGGKRSIGFSDSRRPSPFTEPLPLDSREILHVAYKNLLALNHFTDISTIPIRPSLQLNKNDNIMIYKSYPTAKECVLVNLSAGDHSRYWPENNWRILIDFLIDRGEMVILTAIGDLAGIAEDISAKCSQVRMFRGSVHELTALISKVKLVITPDTAIVHIASAFNRPQVTLFPAIQWNKWRFAPLSDLYEQILPDEGNSFADIDQIRVQQACERLLSVVNN